MLYNNVEGYIQDNWKVNSRLTVDAGVRFTHQQPQYDQFQQMSNFFPDQWKASAAPVLYISGCSNGAVVVLGQHQERDEPDHGQILVLPNSANSQAAIGTPVPGIGNPVNGIRQAGDGISKTGYTWPNIVVGPRFGVAYDMTGNQSHDFPRRRRYLLRPSRRQHGVLDSRQPADRDVHRSADRPVPEPEPGPELPAGPGHDDLPVRRQGAGLGAVGVRHPENAAVGIGRGRLLRRQPRLQPPRRVPERQPGQPQRDRLRRRLPGAEPGPDASVRRRFPAPAPTRRPICCGPIGAWATSTRTPPSSTTPTTRSRATSTAASATASASAPTTR